ncbi:MAG: WbuC family cupin fold metalloprotein [Desulfuromonadales bacterium]|nr:WbuC family cupin fold metalloprotein [Desulfuromonadales bacterium]
MKIIDLATLDRLSAEAQNSSRKRMNLNLHASYSEPCQRLLNAVEPDSYIRPHRHLTPLKPETFVVLRGRFAAAIFDDAGEVEQAVLLDADAGPWGVDIPAGAWHVIFALEAGSVFFETKPGPYEPISDKDWAAWAPAEGSVGAEEYMRGVIENIRGILNFEF